MLLKDLRLELTHYASRTVAERLTTGAGGNISASDGHTMLISPSGFSLEDISPELWVEVEIESGQVAANGLRPSSETLMHLACYRRRPDVHAIVHTHPRYTIALTCSGHDLQPTFADAVIYLGKRVPHLSYITVTTPELAEAVRKNVDGVNCIILRNHGSITVGANLKQAFWRACTVEEAAKIQVFATLLGKPTFLDQNEADRLEALDSEQYRRELIAQLKA